MSSNIPLNTSDIVFVDSLRVTANIGPDCWGRPRAQPIDITVYLHLKPSYLNSAGESDNVADSVHYGHLTKSIEALLKERSTFDDANKLIQAVSQQAFELAGEVAEEVRVVMDAPKLILLAQGGFSVDAIVTRRPPDVLVSRKVLVRDLVLPVVIGVNPPEREAKQRVVVNITFFEDTRLASLDYQEAVGKLCKYIEASSYLTLEKFVMEIVRMSCLSSEVILAVTVRAQKPSALSFAQSSGVEITRRRQDFI